MNEPIVNEICSQRPHTELQDTSLIGVILTKNQKILPPPPEPISEPVEDAPTQPTPDECTRFSEDIKAIWSDIGLTMPSFTQEAISTMLSFSLKLDLHDSVVMGQYGENALKHIGKIFEFITHSTFTNIISQDFSKLEEYHICAKKLLYPPVQLSILLYFSDRNFAKNQIGFFNCIYSVDKWCPNLTLLFMKEQAMTNRSCEVIQQYQQEIAMYLSALGYRLWNEPSENTPLCKSRQDLLIKHYSRLSNALNLISNATSNINMLIEHLREFYQQNQSFSTVIRSPKDITVALLEHTPLYQTLNQIADVRLKHTQLKEEWEHFIIS